MEDSAMLLRFDVVGEDCVKTIPVPYPTWEQVKFLETKTVPTFKTGMTEDNLLYTKPEKIIKKLKQIDKIVPNSDVGAYFVNGLSKGLQISKDD